METGPSHSHVIPKTTARWGRQVNMAGP
uniref:Uncharacterized protein n=1 Tax=Anguilla anguilla TaxID=7936 RepID=A0A0E9W5E5_ANGAN